MPALRRLTIDDHAAILALWQRAGLHSIRPEGRDSRAEFEKQLVIGLEEDDQLIGVVLATQDTRKGWINRLAIDPKYQRRGYGEQLVHAAEEALHQVGMQLIAAFIEEGNTASLALFKKLGYLVHQDITYVSKRASAEV